MKASRRSGVTAERIEAALDSVDNWIVIMGDRGEELPSVCHIASCENEAILQRQKDGVLKKIAGAQLPER